MNVWAIWNHAGHKWAIDEPIVTLSRKVDRRSHHTSTLSFSSKNVPLYRISCNYWFEYNYTLLIIIDICILINSFKKLLNVTYYPGLFCKICLELCWESSKLISGISLRRIPFTCTELTTKGASMNQRRSVLFCLYLFWTESELSESNDGSVFRFLYPINTTVILDKILDLLFSLRIYRWCRHCLFSLSLYFSFFSLYFFFFRRNPFDCARL